MAQPSLAELTRAAAEADAPSFTDRSKVALGGVDPLGLRQILDCLGQQRYPVKVQGEYRFNDPKGESGKLVVVDSMLLGVGRSMYPLHGGE